MLNKKIIYRNNLINNIKQVKKENPNSKICAMVKSNAYGVGDKIVVQTLESFVDFWGVACFFEAKRISSLTKRPILIVGACGKDEVDERFSYSCFDLEQLEFLISLNKKINIHLKINTGMNRFGFKNLKDLKKALKMILNSRLNLEGIFTHFATNDEFTQHQMNEFKKFVQLTHTFGLNPIVHADNSFVNEQQNHQLDMVRIGFSLYNRCDGWFLPAIEIKSTVVQIQDVKKNELIGYNYRCVAKSNMKVAIMPLGYADGFDMKFLGIEININGIKCKVLNICMDCFMLDVTKTNFKKGDEIYLLNKFNPLKAYADYAETSVYEVMTKFSHMRAEKILI